MHPLIILRNLSEQDRKTFLKSIRTEDLALALSWTENNYAIVEAIKEAMAEDDARNFGPLVKKTDEEIKKAAGYDENDLEHDLSDFEMPQSVVDAREKVVSTLKSLFEKGEIKMPSAITPGVSGDFERSMELVKKHVRECIEKTQENRAVLGNYILEEKKKIDPEKTDEKSDDDDDDFFRGDPPENEFCAEDTYNLCGIEADLIDEIEKTIGRYFARKVLGDTEYGFYENSLHDDFIKIGDDARRRIFARLIVEYRDELREVLERSYIKFQDIKYIGDRDVQKFLREVDAQMLARGLKDTDNEVKEKIFRNMSRRAAAMLKEDMEYMGPIRRSDVYEAQDAMAKILEKLSKNGEIVLGRNDSEDLGDDVIY